MDHEDGLHISRDVFYQEGYRIMLRERQELREWQQQREEQAATEEEERVQNRDVELLEGRLKREELKKSLFAFFNSCVGN